MRKLLLFMSIIMLFGLSACESREASTSTGSSQVIESPTDNSETITVDDSTTVGDVTVSGNEEPVNVAIPATSSQNGVCPTPAEWVEIREVDPECSSCFDYKTGQCLVQPDIGFHVPF